MSVIEGRHLLGNYRSEIVMSNQVAELSREWILGDASDSPIGRFDEFEFLFEPEQLANTALGFWAMSEQGPTATCTCTCTCYCTTYCGPIGTHGACGC